LEFKGDSINQISDYPDINTRSCGINLQLNQGVLNRSDLIHSLYPFYIL